MTWIGERDVDRRWILWGLAASGVLGVRAVAAPAPARLARQEAVDETAAASGNVYRYLSQATQARVAARTATTADAEEITAAANMCFAENEVVYFPRGLWLLNGQIGFKDGSRWVFGDGAGATELRWTRDAATSGMVIASGPSLRRTTVGSLSLTTEKAGVGTALTIDCTGTADDQTVRAAPRLALEDLIVSGAGKMSNSGWRNGASLINVMNVSVSRFAFAGHVLTPAGPYNDGVALGVDGQSGRGFGPVVIFLEHIRVSAAGTAVRIANTEGVYLSQFEFNTVNKGVVVDNRTVEPGLMISDGHINAFSCHMELRNVAEFKISGVLCYMVANPGRDINGITLVGAGGNGLIYGNIFKWYVSNRVCQAIHVDGPSNISIFGNHFDVGPVGRAVDITAAAKNVRVMNNLYISGERPRNASATSQVEQ